MKCMNQNISHRLADSNYIYADLLSISFIYDTSNLWFILNVEISAFLIKNISVTRGDSPSSNNASE